MTTRHVDNPLLRRIHADYRAKLAAENERAEALRELLPGIMARAEATRAARIAMVFAVHWRAAKLRHMAKHQLTLPLWEREMVVTMPSSMLIHVREALYCYIEEAS